MTRKEYNQMTEADLVGRFIRLTCDIQSGAQTIQKGGVLVITRKFGGFDANSQPCHFCGVGFRIKRLQPEDVELLPKSFRPRWGKQ